MNYTLAAVGFLCALTPGAIAQNLENARPSIEICDTIEHRTLHGSGGTEVAVIYDRVRDTHFLVGGLLNNRQGSSQPYPEGRAFPSTDQLSAVNQCRVEYNRAPRSMIRVGFTGKLVFASGNNSPAYPNGSESACFCGVNPRLNLTGDVIVVSSSDGSDQRSGMWHLPPPDAVEEN